MNQKAMCHVIIAAAGSGSRMGLDCPKQFADLAGKPIWIRTLERFFASEAVRDVTIVIPSNYELQCRDMLRAHNITRMPALLEGGADRSSSVYKALSSLPGDTEIVLIHDAVRPFVTVAQIEAVAHAARLHDAAVLSVPVKDTVKEIDADGRIAHTPARASLMLAQTPQGFRLPLLRHAYERALADGFAGTDDASYVERLDIRPVIVPGDYRNIKLTTPEDLLLAAAFL